MKKAVLRKNGKTVLNKIEIADNFFTRFRGLMFRKSIPADYGLLIKPCNQIHMFNMRFPLDVVYISANKKIVKIEKNVQPGVVCKTVKNAKSVLEINSGTADEAGLSEGDELTFEAFC